MEQKIIDILERYFPTNYPCPRKRRLALANQKKAAELLMQLFKDSAPVDISDAGECLRNYLKDKPI